MELILGNNKKEKKKPLAGECVILRGRLLLHGVNKLIPSLGVNMRRGKSFPYRVSRAEEWSLTTMHFLASHSSLRFYSPFDVFSGCLHK